MRFIGPPCRGVGCSLACHGAGCRAPGPPLSKLEGWLGARRGRPVVVLGCAVAGVASDEARAGELSQTLLHARRVKDEVELGRMRAAAAATAPGYATAKRMIRAGVTER